MVEIWAGRKVSRYYSSARYVRRLDTDQDILQLSMFGYLLLPAHSFLFRRTSLRMELPLMIPSISSWPTYSLPPGPV